MRLKFVFLRFAAKINFLGQTDHAPQVTSVGAVVDTPLQYTVLLSKLSSVGKSMLTSSKLYSIVLYTQRGSLTVIRKTWRS